MFLVDSHCHLNKLNYQFLHKNISDVLEKAAIKNVKFFLSVSTTLSDYCSIRKFVGKRKNVVFSCGVHPLHQNEEYSIDKLKKLSSEEDVVAVGETGLDYHHLSVSRIKQQISFRNHIRVGRELKKPIIVHARSAYSDMLVILREEKITDCRGVLHCFNTNKKIASKLLDLGFYISFSGIITFRNAKEVQESACYIPLDRLLLETDSPYLAPVPYRGKENHPALLYNIAEYIATLKNIDIAELAKITTENFFNLFKINPSRLSTI